MMKTSVEGRPALEVIVCFDGAVLAAEQLTAGAFRIGEGTAFPLIEGTLPVATLPVAGVDEGEAWIAFPDGSEGDVTVSGARRTLAELTAAGAAPPLCDGIRRHALEAGASAMMILGPLTLVVRRGAAARRLPRPLRLDWSAHRFTLAVAAGLLLFLGLAFSVPPDPRSQPRRAGNSRFGTRPKPQAR